MAAVLLAKNPVMQWPMILPKLLRIENSTLILMLIIPHPRMTMTQPQTLPVTLLFRQ